MTELEALDRRYRVIAGRTLLFDGEGFLWDPAEWGEEVAEELARESGLGEALDEMRWRVVRFLREFYARNGRAPLNKILRQGTGLALRELEGLFPGGIKYGLRRIAGLPNPKHCQ